MKDGRDSRGRFKAGNQIARGHGHGRPPRSYSISTALAVGAGQPESTDDQGDPLTAAQVAARWLWRIVTTGLDHRTKPDGGVEAIPVSTRDRMHALTTILDCIEPRHTLTADDFDREDSEDMLAQLDSMSKDELQVLAKLGLCNW